MYVPVVYVPVQCVSECLCDMCVSACVMCVCVSDVIIVLALLHAPLDDTNLCHYEHLLVSHNHKVLNWSLHSPHHLPE